MRIGEKAVFRCQNLGAVFVFWNFNGSMVTQTPPPDITPATTLDRNNHLVHILTIVARLEFNGTLVECGALLQNGSRILTPSVELLIAGIYNQVNNIIIIITDKRVTCRDNKFVVAIYIILL